MHILIVEDDPLILRELKILLENALYQVTISQAYAQISDQVIVEKPDLVLLDVNLPDISGFDICTRIREKTDVPVIFLTSRTDSMDELTGMLKGGDDYITKPYQAPILLARIAAVLKRTKAPQVKEHALPVVKNMELDTAKCSLIYHVPDNSEKSEYAADDQSSSPNGRKTNQCSGCGRSVGIELTKNEMKILFALFSRAGEYVTRMDLIEYLWENDIFIDDNTLSVHVARIREKLKAVGVTDFIETKRGIGYRI